MAREHSIVTAILVTGDADLVEAVSQAQQHGVRVILWGVQSPQSTMSPDLQVKPDRVRCLTANDLSPFFTTAIPAPLVIDSVSPVPVSPIDTGPSTPRSTPSRPRRTVTRAMRASR